MWIDCLSFFAMWPAEGLCSGAALWTNGLDRAWRRVTSVSSNAVLVRGGPLEGGRSHPTWLSREATRCEDQRGSAGAQGHLISRSGALGRSSRSNGPKAMTVLFGHPSGNPNSHHAGLSHLESGWLEAFCVPWMPSPRMVSVLSRLAPSRSDLRRLTKRGFGPLEKVPKVQGWLGE